MKVITWFATIHYGVVAFAPQASTITTTAAGSRYHRTHLDATREPIKGGKNALGGVASFLIGLVAAGQVAIADPSSTAVMIENTFQTGPSSTMISIGAPSFSAGSSFDTLDFSLPSYDEATKGGDVSSGGAKSAPAFTADFPELKLPREQEQLNKEAAVDEAAVKKKAAEDEKAAKAKAKEEARLAKEKEAEEKAAAEEKKKAEIAARREAEKKKQEEMVARQRAAEEKEKAAAAAAAKGSEESVVPVKKVEVVPPPSPPAPKPAPVSVPEVSVPEFKMPQFNAPDIKVPSFSAPKIEAPKFEAPKFEVPAAPSVSLPKPSSTSSYDLDIKTPPSVPSFSSSAPAPKVQAEPLESQEVRDAKARASKEKFKNLDDEAKAFEQKAQEARELAKAAKKEAKIAKDAACETRPGGKVLCIRPFGIGY